MHIDLILFKLIIFHTKLVKISIYYISSITTLYYSLVCFTPSSFSTITSLSMHLCLCSPLIILGIQLECATGTPNAVWYIEHIAAAIPLDSHLGHLHEGVLHCDVFFRACLVIGHVTVLLAPGFCICCLNFPVIFTIQFIADKYEWESIRVMWGSMLNEPIPPFIQIVETLLTGYIVYQGAAISTTIKGIPK